MDDQLIDEGSYHLVEMDGQPVVPALAAIPAAFAQCVELACRVHRCAA